MDSDSDKPWQCVFCGERQLVRTHSGLYHPLKKDHGPFDFYVCSACGSGLTLPPPTPAALSQLYGSFESGLPAFHRSITAGDPQVGLTKLCVRRLAKLSQRSTDESFRWLDVGAGGGELAVAMLQRFPNSQGVAVDLHERPPALDGVTEVQWTRADVNAADFSRQIAAQADVIFSISVWEHVTAPDVFVENLIRLLGGKGLLYLLAPNFGSLTRKLLRDRWPYFTPGEHLFMPTPCGARTCLQRAWTSAGGTGEVHISVRPKLLPYTFRYVARRLHMPGGSWIPKSWRVPLPAGALEAILQVG